ncbi:unnamed protein product [Symbiodinium natans]|uniref:Uncharacterized protein n=1 Tax=Symbiodinium natans TaxID=878477 RepID=A0A812L9V3_9DINO|nr:unnamed protein product [Symbiodinium natans]
MIHATAVLSFKLFADKNHVEEYAASEAPMATRIESILASQCAEDRKEIDDLDKKIEKIHAGHKEMLAQWHDFKLENVKENEKRYHDFKLENEKRWQEFLSRDAQKYAEFLTAHRTEWRELTLAWGVLRALAALSLLFGGLTTIIVNWDKVTKSLNELTQ